MTTKKEKDIITLAEAIGWRKSPINAKLWLRGDDDLRDSRTAYLYELPDPFTDANDDYAVLEWARTRLNYTLTRRFYESCANITRVSDYKIGDYARALLKALKGPL